MSNHAAEYTYTPSGASLTQATRRNLVIALAIAVVLEVFSRVFSRLDIGSDFTLNLVSIVAATLAGTTVVILVSHTCHRKSITATMVVAASAIIGSSLLNAAGDLPAFENTPLIGSQSPYHSLATSIADIVGISSWIFGFFGLVFELHWARETLGEQHRLLEREAGERERMERSLVESEALFRAVFERVDAGIAILDLQGNIIRCNPALCESLEMSITKLQAMDILALVVEEQRASLSRGLENLAAGKNLAHREEYRVHGAHRDDLWFSIALTSFTPTMGPVECLVAIFEDLTHRKEQESRFLHQQKMESIGLLAGGIAHDFNNLFVGIMANAELLSRDAAQNESNKSICRDIVTSTQRAASLCQQLLAYAGKARMERENLDVSALVESSRPLFELGLDSHAKLVLDCPANLPAVFADPSQVRQAILYMLTNASDALKGRNGKIHVSSSLFTLAGDMPEGYVAQEFVPPPGEYVSVTVVDDGKGFSNVELEKLFDPYYSTKEKDTGLGLAAVHGIVRAHSGFMTVRSRRSQGAEFRLLFPSTGKMIPQRPPTPPAENAETASPAQGTILLVDDEEMVLGAARRILERSGYSVLSARNGKEGVEVFRTRHKDLSAVVLDLTMPVMDGESASREMHAIDPEVPILLSSGYSETDSNASNAVAHASGYIRKPYRIGTLLEAVQAAIGTRRTP